VKVQKSKKSNWFSKPARNWLALISFLSQREGREDGAVGVVVLAVLEDALDDAAPVSVHRQVLGGGNGVDAC